MAPARFMIMIVMSCYAKSSYVIVTSLIFLLRLETSLYDLTLVERRERIDLKHWWSPKTSGL